MYLIKPKVEEDFQAPKEIEELCNKISNEVRYREGYKRAMESYRTEDMHYQYFIQFMRDVNSRISKLEKHIEGSWR